MYIMLKMSNLLVKCLGYVSCFKFFFLSQMSCKKTLSGNTRVCTVFRKNLILVSHGISVGHRLPWKIMFIKKYKFFHEENDQI